MRFNYAKERKKFDLRWEKLRDFYKSEGMSEPAIEQLYQFDLELFRSERRFANRMQPLPPLHIVENAGRSSELFKKFYLLKTQFDESDFSGRYAWIDTIEDPALLNQIPKLSKRDLELLTYLVIEGHTQKELAQKWSCTQKSISNRLKKIKKILKKGV